MRRPPTMKRYWIQMKGFDGHEVEAYSASGARYKTFLNIVDAGYYKHNEFRQFLADIEVFHHHGRAWR